MRINTHVLKVRRIQARCVSSVDALRRAGLLELLLKSLRLATPLFRICVISLGRSYFYSPTGNFHTDPTDRFLYRTVSRIRRTMLIPCFLVYVKSIVIEDTYASHYPAAQPIRLYDGYARTVYGDSHENENRRANVRAPSTTSRTAINVNTVSRAHSIPS